MNIKTFLENLNNEQMVKIKVNNKDRFKGKKEFLHGYLTNYCLDQLDKYKVEKTELEGKTLIIYVEKLEQEDIR